MPDAPIAAGPLDIPVGRVDYVAFGRVSVEWFHGSPEPGTTLYKAPPDLARENYKLRMMLFMAHGVVGKHCLYGDDGERHCNTCMIDFVRDSVDEIERKIHEYNMRELARMHPEWVTPNAEIKRGADE